jgi:hypothetical protein
MVELVDESDLGAANARTLGVGQRRGRGAVDIDFASVRMLEQPRDVQQRRLTGARGRDQRHGLPGPHRELGTFEDFERAAP